MEVKEENARISEIKNLLKENLHPVELDGYSWKYFLSYDVGDNVWSWRADMLNTCGMPYFEKINAEVHHKLNSMEVTPKELVRAFVELKWC